MDGIKNEKSPIAHHMYLGFLDYSEVGESARRDHKICNVCLYSYNLLQWKDVKQSEKKRLRAKFKKIQQKLPKVSSQSHSATSNLCGHTLCRQHNQGN